MPDPDLLDEICDDPDDEGSDYGRGFAAGRRSVLADVLDALRNLEADQTWRKPGDWPRLARLALTDRFGVKENGDG